MHLMVTKLRRKDQVFEYAKIVQSYWDGKTSRQKVLVNLGRIRSPEDRRRFEEILESMRRGEKTITVSLRDVEVLNNFDFGVIYAVEKLWDAYGISRVLTEAIGNGRFEFDATRIVRLLVARRLHAPSSDLSTYEWIQKEAFADAGGIKPQHIYRALDQLIKHREKIEVGIFKEFQRTLGLKTDLVFYDLTSSYFEGEGPELAKYGKSKDNKPDRKQLVLALAMIDGIPLAHEVFEGNTADRPTLKHAVKKLKGKFNIGRIIFVADRGLFSRENLDFLDEEGYEYIIATRRRLDREMEELMTSRVEAKGRVFAKEVKRAGNRRYILCVNRDVEQEEREFLREHRRFLERRLKELADSYARARGRPSGQSVLNRASKILGRYKRLFNLEFDGGLKFSLDRKIWAYENAIAGKFLLATTSPLTANGAMESYKELRSVEDAFREIKNFVDIRPMFHSKDCRVKAHVFECVLSYLTEALIGKLVPHQSARRTIQELRRMEVTEILMGKERMFFVRKMKNSDLKIFELLKIEVPPKNIEL
jgi:transposase